MVRAMESRSSWETHFSATSAAIPQLHDEVCFINGKALGTVVVAGGRGFKVRIGDVELWLNNDAVFTRQGGRVTLVCEPSGLHRYATLPASRRGHTRSSARP